MIDPAPTRIVAAMNILFDAPIAVLELRAKYLASIRPRIRQDMADIAAEFPDPECFDVATNAYANRIGVEISDRVLRSSVKKIARIEIWNIGA